MIKIPNYNIFDNYYKSQCTNCRNNDSLEYQELECNVPDPDDALTVIFCNERQINMMRFPSINCEYYKRLGK